MLKTKEAYNEYMRKYMKERYKRRRKEAIETLGGKCKKCGSQERLEFHHLDAQTKEMTIARASSLSEARWQEEIQKCHLLCNACHKAEHASKAPCGTMQRYWAGCRCPECRKANAIKGREYKRRRSTTKETLCVNVVKFGEPFDMAIPSQASKEEGVET